jgi:hypothetical protein
LGPHCRQFIDIYEVFGVPAAIRTRDLQLRRLPLYPAELRGRLFDLWGFVAGGQVLIAEVGRLAGGRR